MKNVIKWLLYLLALTPLIVDSSVYFPYITGKTMLVRLAVSAAALLYASYLFFSDQFRKEQLERFKKIIKNPITIFTLSFFAVFIVSAAFAMDTFRAFFGDVERAEGVFGMMYFYVFMMLSALLFESKDWLNFFRITLVTGTILFVHEMIQFFSGTVRPASFTGNPIYLAAFFLFVIMSSLLVIADETKKHSGYWRILAWPILPLSIVGIFVTESRGVIVGMAAAIVALAVYFAFRGKEIKLFRKISLKTISIYALAAVVIFSGLFFATRTANFWKKVPGLDRLSQVSSTDISTQTRLIAFGVGLDSINPAKNTLKEFLIGWGPENFHIAYNIHYNPRYFEFEQQWFDRAHNKLMDVAVMNGMVGLLAYLGLWISLFWMAVKKKENIWESAILIFFGVSYFVQNLFVFDSISTYTPFFVMLAFGIFLTSKHSEPAHQNSSKMTKGEIAYISGSSVVALFMAFAAVAFFLVPYFQMRTFLDLWRSGDANQVMKAGDELTPYTYAQENIRTSFLDYSMQYLGQNNDNANKIFEQALNSVGELVQNEPLEPRDDLALVRAFAYLAQASRNVSYLQLAENYARRAYSLAPKRQDVRVQLAYTLAQEGKKDEAIKLLKDTIALDPKVGDVHYYFAAILSSFGGDYKEVFSEMEDALNSGNFTKLMNGNEVNTVVIQTYEQTLKDALANRDENIFVGSAQRLEQLVPDQKSELENIINFAQKGMWGNIKLLSK